MDRPSSQQILDRVGAKYLEMPGLSLEIAQVRRLCGVGHETSERVLELLVAARFLRVKSNGDYARRGDGVVSRGPAWTAHLLDGPSSAVRAR